MSRPARPITGSSCLELTTIIRVVGSIVGSQEMHLWPFQWSIFREIYTRVPASRTVRNLDMCTDMRAIKIGSTAAARIVPTASWLWLNTKTICTPEPDIIDWAVHHCQTRKIKILVDKFFVTKAPINGSVAANFPM